MRYINTYKYETVTSNGASLRECRADNRRDAALALKCPVHAVEFVERVKRTAQERRADHAAKVMICDWKLDSIRDINDMDYRRPKKKGKQKAVVKKAKGK